MIVVTSFSSVSVATYSSIVSDPGELPGENDAYAYTDSRHLKIPSISKRPEEITKLSAPTSP